MDKSIKLGTIFTGRIDASLNTSIAKLTESLVKMNALMKASAGSAEGKRSVDALTQSYAALKKELNDTARKEKQQTKALGAVTTSYNNASKAVGTYTAAQKKANASTKAQKGALASLGKAFKTLAAYMVAGRGIMLFTQALRGGIVEIANFDQSLHNIQAITSATDTQILGMKATIISLAQSTKFSTGELAKGMVLLGQSGFDASESVSALTAVATLASATLSGLESTSQLLTTTIRAYGLEAIEAGRVSDVMANAVNKSKLTIDKLNTSFNYVGVTASQAGLSVEETAASMMVLANNGLRASTIGTGLRQVLSRLVAPNKKLREAFHENHIEISKVNPTIVGYGNSLKELSKVLWDSEGDVVDMGKAFSIFGLRGAQAAAVIVKSYVGGKYQTAMEKVVELGTAEKMQAEQAEGLAFKFKNLKDTIETLAVSLGDAGLLGAFRGIVDVLKGGILGLVAAMNTSAGQAVTSFVLLTAATSGLILSLRMLATTKLGTMFVTWANGF
ncbi:MAG: phage tail tape measure protein, partial [Thermoplasmata archaeon]